MRAAFHRALWLTLALSGAALWPRPQPVVVQAAVPAARPADSGDTAPGPAALTVAEPMQVEMAAGDPFARAVDAAVPAAAPQPPHAAPPAATVMQPAPVAPALGHRFFGRLTTPAGEEVTFLARDGAPVAVAEGMTLDDGYVVQAVLPEVIRLVFPSTGTMIDIAVPPAPSKLR